ncbi:uncharacterized membrane protein YsdA (DUF1294 family) [Pedobacter cryoconitis]|uniref:Uncharacterized membrane protein YsdA (DUF1294 family) n=1 Tax=Pedobacter cryoconitis TaxID=188932 RepID=A0A7W8ZQ08_9SPHI|nr:hypothetical protein [Pedobacter cryoconitis]MBB5637817.1 uncharacterized membrane protein YsdA (DUF1294 family) [Pedobacter cryoconitis]MBB6270427.1 uncharacterized membrane protein YsdA (DUF1294 family) [Pedobacter cryoconitis]
MERLIKIILYLLLFALIADLCLFVYRVDRQQAPHRKVNPHSAYPGY